jgi:anti-sigma factor RsiW
MLSEREIELAHPDAFDFAFGNLPATKRAEFNRHLSSCPHCQKVIDEYSDIGRIIQILPPHVEPSADLEGRTVAAMAGAIAEQRASADRPSDAEDRAATRVYPIPDRQPSAEPETRVQPIPQLHHPVEDQAPAQPRPHVQPPAEQQDRPMVTRLPVWRRYPRRLAAVAAAAAAVIVAVVVPLSLSLRQVAPVAISLHATGEAKKLGYGGATARATARQADESWTFTLSVHGLKPLSGNDFYECWWVTPGHTRLLATGGSFVVGNSGSTTVTMTTGVDPTQQFRTMEITKESPSKDGALNGPVLLTS